MKGQILDVYPEGESTFRACILDDTNVKDEVVWVVDLNTGKTSMRCLSECEKPVIENIFNVKEHVSE